LNRAEIERAVEYAKKKELEELQQHRSLDSSGKEKKKRLPSRALVDLEASNMKLLTMKGSNAIMSRKGMRRIAILGSNCASSSLRLLSRHNSFTLQILLVRGGGGRVFVVAFLDFCYMYSR
jgi:hypothetical protein